jgi:hypothetical protein
MPCDIKISVGYRTNTGSFTGLPNLSVIAVPSANTQTYSYAGTWRENVVSNPGIVGNAALNHGQIAVTDVNGECTHTLPYSSGETHPASPEARWSLLFPDGQILSGEVPSVAGPLRVDDLVQTYGWSWSSSVYVAPVTPGTLARGIASFTGASSSVTILFSSPFVSSGYGLKLAPSYDAATEPKVYYSNKSATGFDIVVSDSAYVGTVDWEATL